MSQFDVESFYDFCSAVVQDNIAAKVAEINAEKADAHVIQAPTENQFVSDFSAQLLNENFFIYYELLDTEATEQAGDSVALEVMMRFYALFVEAEDGTDSVKKALRYSRALHEIFLEHYRDVPEISGIEIIQIAPQSTQFPNSSDWYKIGGVEIKGTIVS